MSHNFSWKSQPIFISSTFTDMMAERDVLRDIVFPELEEKLNERRVRLEPIDLRWGVETTAEDEQEKKELMVLKVCLDEIDRCKPFFVGIIGDRYGWIPPESRIKAAEEEKGFKSGIKDKSVTALEIEYGVLASKEQLQRSFFFFREPLPYNEMPEKVRSEYSDKYNSGVDTEEVEKKLKDLKEEIIKKVGKEKVFTYKANCVNGKVTGLEEFRTKIIDVLWKELDGQTKELEDTRPKTWEEEEQKYLEDFIEDRTVSFSGREDVINELKEFALSEPSYDSWGICLTGETGLGKSALFAKLNKELKKDMPQGENVILLSHAAGISLRSNSVTNMLTIWIKELAGHLQIDVTKELEESSKYEDLVKKFAELLSRQCINKRVVVLVDAINQFENTTHAKYVNWLPKLIPANAKFIFTAIEGEETNNLTKREGVKKEELKPVNRADAEKIINIICERYHKTLNQDATAILLEKQREDGKYAYTNPLWLTMAVDEFLLLDEDDFARMKGLEGDAEQKLKQLLMLSAKEMPADIPGMYNYVFDRCKIFGEEFVKAILSYVGISRNGLRENDLEAIINSYTNTKWDNLNFASFRRYLRNHLVQKGELGLWDFRHTKARESLKDTFLGNTENVTTLHQNLADYLETLNEEDPLRLTEILWHLFKCDEKEKAALIYGSFEADDYKTTRHSQTIKDILVDDEKNIVWFCSLLQVEGIGDDVLRIVNNNVWFNLADKIKDEIKLKPRLKLLQNVEKTASNLTERNPNSVEYARDLSISFGRVGDIYTSLGDTKTALERYESSNKIFQELVQRNPDSAKYARDLSISYNRIGDIYTSLGDTKTALERYESSNKIFQELVQRNPDSAFYARDLSVSLSKVGNIYTVFGDTKLALEKYESSLKIDEELVQRNPNSVDYLRGLSVSLEKVGTIYETLGNTKSALERYESSMNIRLVLAKKYPDSVDYSRGLSISLEKVGNIYTALGDTKTALERYKSSLKIREELVQRNPDFIEYARDLSVSFNKLGGIYITLGDTKNALARYESSHQIFQKLVERVPDSTEYVRDLFVSFINVGDIYASLGDTKTALERYKSSLNMAEKLVQKNPDSAEYAKDLSISYERLGNIYTSLGDTKTALERYEGSLNIAEELLQRNPDSAEYARGLSVSLDKIGDIHYLVLGDIKTALVRYESSHIIFQELLQRNPDSAICARDLFVSFIKVGDIYKAVGDTKKALERYESSLNIVEELVQRNPDSAEYARDLSISIVRIGDIYKAVGDTKTALERYESSRKIFQELVKRNPASVDYVRHLSFLHERVGNIYDALGDTKSAIERYESSLNICKELWEKEQYTLKTGLDLALLYHKVGDTFLRFNDSQNALEKYQSSMLVWNKLLSQKPESNNYLRGLVLTFERIADVLRATNDFKQALTEYEKASSIILELKNKDPKSELYLQDLSRNYARIGDVYSELGDLNNVCKYYEEALVLREELCSINSSSVEYLNSLAMIYFKLTRLYQELNDPKVEDFLNKFIQLLQNMKSNNIKFIEPLLPQIGKQLGLW